MTRIRKAFTILEQQLDQVNRFKRKHRQTKENCRSELGYGKHSKDKGFPS